MFLVVVLIVIVFVSVVDVIIAVVGNVVVVQVVVANMVVFGVVVIVIAVVIVVDLFSPLFLCTSTSRNSLKSILSSIRAHHKPYHFFLFCLRKLYTSVLSPHLSFNVSLALDCMLHVNVTTIFKLLRTFAHYKLSQKKIHLILLLYVCRFTKHFCVI